MIRVDRVEWMVLVLVELDVRTALDRIRVNPEINEVTYPVDDAADLDIDIRASLDSVHETHSNLRVA
jgi:hypothetical protein